MKQLTEDEFKDTEMMCSRWDETTLKIAKKVLVEGQSQTLLAAEYKKTPQQITNIKKRFLAKFNVLAARMFMEQEKPADLSSQLKLHKPGIEQLLAKGYLLSQVVTYLEENGIKATELEIQTFLRSEKR